MPSTYSTNLHLELQATGENTNVWGQELNNNVFTILDSVLGNTFSLPLASADVTLTTLQAQNNFIDLNGIITANINVIFPAIGRTFFVRNGTSGAFTVTLKTVLSGATFVIPQGTTAFVVLNGTDVLPTPQYAWELIGDYSSTSVNTLMVLNLSAFRKIRISGKVTSSAQANLLLRTSTDNGVTLDGGASDYAIQLSYSVLASQNAGGSITAFMLLTPGINDASSPITFECILEGFNKPETVEMHGRTSFVSASSLAVGTVAGQRNAAVARNALAVQISPGTFSGKITVEGIRG